MKRRTRILVPSRELTLLNCDAPMLDRRQGHRRAIGLSCPTRTQRRGSSIVSRTAPPWRQAAQADRQAFDRALAPTYPELLQAAQRELRHRLTLGQFAPDNPTPEQLLDMALQRVWRERRRLSLDARHQSLLAGLDLSHSRSPGCARRRAQPDDDRAVPRGGRVRPALRERRRLLAIA